MDGKINTDLDEIAEIRQMQIELLYLLPQWHYRIAKPFKQLLDEGISLEMYYCLQTLRWLGGMVTMSELGQWAHIPKQQMTKMVNRMVEHNFVERVYDPSDRRIINIRITDVASDYIEYFLAENAKCFQSLLEQMNKKDRAAFKQAIETITGIFDKLPLNNTSVNPE